MPKFNGEELTPETIQRTRQHFAENRQACIDEILSGDVVLPSQTQRELYFEMMRIQAKSYLNGEYDNTLTFLQRAYWIQTGKSIALLP